MVLDIQTIEKIKSLVYQKPRSINEIAIALQKNWRTADRYVEDIMNKSGTIKIITFREGTRGALKIVYWNNTEKIYSTDVQEQLFKKIELGIDKSDFSPFEIYQYIDSEKRDGTYEEIKDENNYDYKMGELAPYFQSAEKEISIFAGNLAFIHVKYKNKKMLKFLKDCVERKISIKIITNINLADLSNVEEILSLNTGLRDHLVEIRHEITPLRAYIFDNKLFRMGEIIISNKKEGQIKSTVAVYYEIRDDSWVDWMQKLFWKKFQNSIQSKLRIENMKTLRKI